jgi:hypothetical protein
MGGRGGQALSRDESATQLCARAPETARQTTIGT